MQSSSLSVCIPNYNHGCYLPESLEAIFSQSYSPDEVIVIDDGSTDESISIVERYQKQYPNLRLIRHTQNQGMHATAVEAVKEAKGEYFGIYAADDLVMPGCFEKSMGVFLQHPEVTMTFGDGYLFKDSDPSKLDRFSLLERKTPLILMPDDFITLCRKGTFHVPSNTCVFKRDLLLRLHAYDTPELKSWSDFFLNCQITLRYPTAYIPHPLGAFRCSTTSYGQRTGSAYSQRKEIALQFLQKVDKEDKDFKNKLRRSGLLRFGGFSMILALLPRPQYWSYLPLMIRKKLPDLPHTLLKWMKRPFTQNK